MPLVLFSFDFVRFSWTFFEFFHLSLIFKFFEEAHAIFYMFNQMYI